MIYNGNKYGGVVFMRPILTTKISVDSFKEFYWLKAELQTFCRENGLSTSGSKLEITDRIETFIRTGEIKKSIKNSKVSKKIETQINLSLNTIITENHRCSQNVRKFFKTIIPKFHFSTYIQDYFKHNVGKTYRDAVDAWFEEEARKKDPLFKKNIAPQFEYNQFIRDYFQDVKNKGKSRDEAIKAWYEVKKLPGRNKYISKE